MKDYKVVFKPTDSLNERLKKAAHVKPSHAQLRWMRRGYIAFLHYSPNTFTNRQWGNGSETADCFCPSEQSTAQWAHAAAQAGLKMIIPTLKHHDGFCQWNTESTDFSIANCPVKEDIALTLSEACAREGIDFGVYLSPWDMHQREKGIWNTPKYQKLYMLQLRELMTRYGRIGELWLDGACGDMPIWTPVKTYSPDEWYDLMESTQPDCVVRNYDPFEYASEEEWEKLKNGSGEINWRGKELRWVGNEDGAGREDEWSVQPVFHRTHSWESTLNDLGEEKYYPESVGAVWYPNEVNTHLLNQWFWNEETSHVRGLDELIDIFYHSIGNNGVLLMNISPDRRGLIPDDQITRLMEFRRFMDDTFGSDAAEGAEAIADSSKSGAPAENLLCEGEEKYWTPNVQDWDIDNSRAVIEIRLPEKRLFDNLLVQEHIAEGQRVAGWRAEALVDGEWKQIAEKKTIGYKAICRFPKVTSDRVRIEILRSWDTPMLTRVSLHLTKKPASKELFSHEALHLSTLAEKPSAPSKGLEYKLYAGGVQSAALIGEDGREPCLNGVTDTINAELSDKAQDYSLLISGYVFVPHSNEAMLKLGSTDGSLLLLDGKAVIDNDEPHSYREKTAYAYLCEGWHTIAVKYTSFRNVGKLRLLWTNPAYELADIAKELLYH